MEDVHFLNSEVVITQPWIALSYLVCRYIWTLLNECCH